MFSDTPLKLHYTCQTCDLVICDEKVATLLLDLPVLYYHNLKICGLKAA